MRYFKDGDKVIKVTEKSPRGFQGVLFIGYEGDKEILVEPQKLREWTEIPNPAQKTKKPVEVPETKPQSPVKALGWIVLGQIVCFQLVKGLIWLYECTY